MPQQQVSRKKQSFVKCARIKNNNSNNNNNGNLSKTSQRNQSHIYNKLKETASGFQQQSPNCDDDLTSSSSSTFSSSSQQHSSVDYEAEDENEEKQRKTHKNENESLVHVQNFLKCFGANALATATPSSNSNTTSSKVGNIISNSSAADLRSWRQNYRAGTVHATNASTPTNAQYTNTNKPQKFQINTKFLRKPRNKLMKMLPTAAVQQQQQQHLAELQLFNDDSNAKFKDFSIDSLLNK